MADLSFDDLLPQKGVAAAPPSSAPDFTDLLPQYSGAILPFSADAAGNNTHFDSNAGIIGMVKRALGAAAGAITAPGDVYSGALTTPYATGQTDPQTINRAVAFASTFSPLSAATRAGEIVPGALTATRAPPTAQQLKAAAGAGYDAARASGLDISGDAVGEMARGLQQSLQADRGIIAKTAPKTFSLLDELGSPPAGGFTTIPGLEAARQGLSNLRLEGGTEGLAASHAVRGIDDFLSSLADSSLAPTATGPAATARGVVPAGQAGASASAPSAADVAALLRNARGNYAAAQRSNDLTGTLDSANTGILERAEARAEASHSGRNLDNAIRQRAASFLQSPQNLAGFSPPEIDALKGVVAGGPVQNTARFIGNLLGGGGGLGHLIGIGAGALAGGHIGGGEGAAIGAMLPSAIGTAAKGVENSIARRSLNSADETVRMNSPLYRAMMNDPLTPAIGGNNVLLRTLLPGLLAPAPASSLAIPPLPTGVPIPQGLLANWA